MSECRRIGVTKLAVVHQQNPLVRVAHHDLLDRRLVRVKGGHSHVTGETVGADEAHAGVPFVEVFSSA